MKLFNRISRRVAGGLVLAAVFAAVPAIIHADGTNSVAAAAKPVPYPLKTCVVSGDKLDGDMGAPLDYVYKQDGKSDRLVRFCCKHCVKDFQKDPAKYLKMIDDAAAKKQADVTARQH